MDKVFIDLIGRNIEVYVDDTVIKSRDEETLLQDVEETVRTLAKAQMKLNATKCTFGVDEGKFLGYEVTTEILSGPQGGCSDYLPNKASDTKARKVLVPGQMGHKVRAQRRRNHLHVVIRLSSVQQRGGIRSTPSMPKARQGGRREARSPQRFTAYHKLGKWNAQG
uniref:Reverse transcriptase domain-containing protein n=1 Tax=Lactuca sativa TaxID=4236 RepID=A0A9R1XMQ3_LACSA|nr:hypothetical protein LSAT_V11C400217080 [Lactuca sativa]